jgi:hypothetical protein
VVSSTSLNPRAGIIPAGTVLAMGAVDPGLANSAEFQDAAAGAFQRAQAKDVMRV